MNVRMCRVFRIPALLVSPRYDHVMTTVYDLHVRWTSVSTDNSELNTAYSRMRTWLLEVMRNSILIGQDHPDIGAWQATGSRCLVFPEEPVDQLVGIMLYRKLDAMVQGRLEITGISVSSALDDDVIYEHDADEEQGSLADNGWWSDSRPTWFLGRGPGRSRDKVISLRPIPEWKEYGLDWDQDTPDSQVVVADFTRDADQ
jgi:hypothetical protein